MIKINKFFIPYIILIVMLGMGRGFFIAFLWIFIHELCHVFVARKMGIKDITLNVIPMGTYIESKYFDEAKPMQDIIISMSGPILNLIFAALFFLINQGDNNFISWSFKSNLFLGVFNLLPAFPLDGARILRAFLNRKFIYKRANIITVKCSILTGVILTICFGFLCFIGKVNISFGLICILIIYISYKERERAVYIIMGDIIKKKNRFLKESYIENKSISVLYNKDLITLLSLMDKNKNNVFTILDEDMRLLGVVYEYEVIDALKEHGNMTVEEYLDIQ